MIKETVTQPLNFFSNENEEKIKKEEIRKGIELEEKKKIIRFTIKMMKKKNSEELAKKDADYKSELAKKDSDHKSELAKKDADFIFDQIINGANEDAQRAATYKYMEYKGSFQGSLIMIKHHCDGIQIIPPSGSRTEPINILYEFKKDVDLLDKKNKVKTRPLAMIFAQSYLYGVSHKKIEERIHIMVAASKGVLVLVPSFIFEEINSNKFIFKNFLTYSIIRGKTPPKNVVDVFETLLNKHAKYIRVIKISENIKVDMEREVESCWTDIVNKGTSKKYLEKFVDKLVQMCKKVAASTNYLKLDRVYQDNIQNYLVANAA